MKKNKKSFNSYAGFIILGIAVCFIIIGIFRDEVTTVIQKATAICMECIGIG